MYFLIRFRKKLKFADREGLIISSDCLAGGKVMFFVEWVVANTVNNTIQ